ncbi:MAG: glycosyltransferase [Anaerolineales bacterium]|nr:glycosyltransferase [Anaerolineales bacterium]
MPELPSITIVTPSFNQAAFLEETIQSVLDQNYPRLDYVIMDGGSTDGSVEIIRRYADRLAYWTSGPDGGQYEAINEGFTHSQGEIMAWINSDDKFVAGALPLVAELFTRFPQIEWMTSLFPLVWDERGRAVGCWRAFGCTRSGFMRGENLPGRAWYANQWIQQESTFWRRSLWERAGGRIDGRYKLAGDFALWTAFMQHAELYSVTTILGGFRRHAAQKTANYMEVYTSEAEHALRAYGGRPYSRVESFFRVQLARRLPGKLQRYLPRAYRPRYCRYDFQQATWLLE